VGIEGCLGKESRGEHPVYLIARKSLEILRLPFSRWEKGQSVELALRECWCRLALWH